jgi:outer membrane protein assembly factor BamA
MLGMRSWTAAALVLALCAPAARGEEPGPARATARGLRGWYAFPGVFYTPETRLGIAGVGGVHFGAAEGLPTSSAELLVYGTQNRQVSAKITALLFPTPAVVLDGKLEASLFPASWFGVGKGTPADAEETYTNRYFDLAFSPQRRLGGAVRAGPRLHLRREVDVGREAGSALAASGLPGSSDWGAAGIGVQAAWDGRNHLFQPSAGGLVDAWYVYYPAALVAGAGAFGRASLDARWFFGPFPRHVLGLQTKLEVAHGEAPVTLLPNIGGNDTFRGYVDGRYRDRFAYSAQAEWRFPIAWRFRGTVFAGAGYVAHDLEDLAQVPFRYAAGAGLRFRLTSTGASIRVDGAYGADGLQIYFLTMEAF